LHGSTDLRFRSQPIANPLPKTPDPIASSSMIRFLIRVRIRTAVERHVDVIGGDDDVALIDDSDTALVENLLRYAKLFVQSIDDPLRFFAIDDALVALHATMTESEIQDAAGDEVASKIRTSTETDYAACLSIVSNSLGGR